jgi:hypothetical protein
MGGQDFTAIFMINFLKYQLQVFIPSPQKYIILVNPNNLTPKRMVVGNKEN